MARTTYLTVMVVLCLWLVGCGTGTESVSPTVEAPVSTPTVALESTAEGMPPESPANPLAGLIYQEGDAFYIVPTSGAPELLFERAANGATSNPVLSPEQTQIVFIRGDDLWLVDLETGAEQQLTNTPDRVERDAIWWPAQPGILIFNYIPVEEMGPWQGYLAALDINSGETTILDDEGGSVSPPAPSPDGQSVAYDRGGKPWLYRWGQGAEPLEVAAQLGENLSFVAPSWSPDGSRLAWKVYGATLDPSLGGESQSAVALFDLAAQSSQLLHPYVIQGGSELYALLEWSPTGEWLAVMNQGELGRMALWVMRPDGSEEHPLGTDGPVWSPDGQFLVYRDSTGAEPQTWLARAFDWEVEALEGLPPGIFVHDWVELNLGTNSQ